MQSLRFPRVNGRRFVRRTGSIVFAAVVGAVVAVGCGGQSEFQTDDGDGASGSAGTGEGGSAMGTGGTAGVGASPSGGVGASPSGGVGASPAGGIGGTTPAGGSAPGGTSSGGTSGASGSSGAGGVCSLPLETGSCNAYFPSFGFSQADGNCQPFVYGGCQGNDNRFSTLAECEATCGGSLSTCPPQAPFNLPCSETGKRCTYDSDDCLCAPKQPYSCTKFDPECTRPGIDGGVSEIIAVLYNLCECRGDSSSAGGTWACNFVTANQ